MPQQQKRDQSDSVVVDNPMVPSSNTDGGGEPYRGRLVLNDRTARTRE